VFGELAVEKTVEVHAGAILSDADDDCGSSPEDDGHVWLYRGGVIQCQG
jgi:hypothetical protein